MPAPDLATLFDFETPIEDVAAVHFKTLYPAWQVLTPRTTSADENKLKTPRLEIRLQVAGSGIQENQRPSDGKWYRSTRTGTLTFRVVAARGKAGQDIGKMAGAVRAGCLELMQMFTGVNLPYYEIMSLVEMSGTPSIFAGNDEIIKELGYAIGWGILPSAFPVS